MARPLTPLLLALTVAHWPARSAAQLDPAPAPPGPADGLTEPPTAAPAPGQPSPWAERPRAFWDSPVVTPAGQPSRVSESPSTTFVITGDELRRTGAPSLVEALRRVPGVDVRVITAVDGQLGLRGFAYEVSDRILVMIDGRTAYIDFFGGTTWEMLPVSILDVERIEIVLGPGASVYGNKAMLGVVNVITRSAADYPWAEARLTAGTPEDGRASARWGALRGPWRLRATALARRIRLFDPRGRHPSSAGGGTLNAAWSPSAGTEAGVEVGAMSGDVFMIPAGVQVQEFDATVAYARAWGRHGLGGPGAPWGEVNLDLVLNGGHITSPLFPDASGDFRADYRTPYAALRHDLRTRLFGLPMALRWGGEVRFNTLDSTMTSGERALWNVAGFASDEVLVGDWRITAGLRVDGATIAGTSLSPRLSVVWTPIEGHQLRAAFNTGYNSPHHVHYFADFRLDGTLPIIGNQGLSAEKVRYGELGWTGSLTGWLRAFANAFAYRFDDWMSLDPSSAVAGAVPWGNNAPFTTVGGELGIDLSVRRAFAAYLNYAVVDTLGAGVDPYGVDPTGSPRHKVGTGFRLDLTEGGYLDVAAQWFGPSKIARVDPVLGNPFLQTRLDGFVMAHARAGYAFANGLDLSVAVTNLLDERTVQFPGAERPERRFSATLGWYH